MTTSVAYDPAFGFECCDKQKEVMDLRENNQKKFRDMVKIVDYIPAFNLLTGARRILIVREYPHAPREQRISHCFRGVYALGTGVLIFVNPLQGLCFAGALAATDVIATGWRRLFPVRV